MPAGKLLAAAGFDWYWIPMMKRSRFAICFLAAAVALSLLQPVCAQFSLYAPRDHYLLLNGDRIASKKGVELVLGSPEKHPKNPLMVEDKPWEPRYDNLYPNVIFDPFEKFYKAWFGPFIVCESTTQTPPEKREELKYLGSHAGRKRESGVLYGTSHDGVLWNKPLLDLNKWDDGAKTNILLRGPHGAGVFRDARDSRRRFKMLYKDGDSLKVRFSKDSIRWEDPLPAEGAEAPGDTHNWPFWAPTRNEYVAITRLWEDVDGKRVRVVGRTASKDFLKWSKVEPVLKGLSPDQQVYAMPVIYHGGVYLGFPAIFDTKTDRVHAELAWSPDTIRWERLNAGIPFLSNGETGGYDWGCVFVGSVVLMNDGARIFYGGSDGPHSGWRKGSLNLAKLQTDRFAGYKSTGPEPGNLLLKPLPYPGGKLRLTADIEEGGSVTISAEDTEGTNVVTEVTITKSGVDIPVEATIPGSTKELVITIRVDRATVYAVGFGK
jgi:hypothetical protein